MKRVVVDVDSVDDVRDEEVEDDAKMYAVRLCE